MSKPFYSRLAITNIRNNKNIYAPYLLASTLLVSLTYILHSITQMVLESDIHGAGSMGFILMSSSWVCGGLSLVVLFYVNSFVIKQRKREFGLYSILGMEKRHISLVVLWEVLLTSVVSIFCGIAGGALLSQLMFLLLLKVVGIPAGLSFQIPMHSVTVTVALFAVGFAVVLAYDVISISRTDPIALLHSSKTGEREPKARWLLALLGVLTLGGGYTLALLVRKPSDAISAFLFAVVLVIAGTYLLFVAGSIALLKLLRRNKAFYYKPKNFIAVSGMLYRMKQNAMGLASICILSSCVLVTLSSSVCLYMGEEDILRNRYPRQVNVTCLAEEDSAAVLEPAVLQHAREYGFAVENARGFANLNYPSERSGDTFPRSEIYSSNTWQIQCVNLIDYNRITGKKETLAAGEALVHVSGAGLAGTEIQLAGQAYQIKGDAVPIDFFQEAEDGVVNALTVVLPEFSDLLRLQDEINNSGSEDSADRRIWYDYWFDLSGDKTRLPDYYTTMRDTLNETVPHLAAVKSIDLSRDSFYQVDGSLLFVGIFFVTLFLIATVLIIYYKQVTEGYDDHDRFQIMEKVGMSETEVRGAIQKQVLMVFFLPLGLAILHIAFAFPVLLKMLSLFFMTNTTLFLLCTGGAILLFTVLYFATYQLTARVYFRIVQGRT